MPSATLPELTSRLTALLSDFLAASPAPAQLEAARALQEALQTHTAGSSASASALDFPALNRRLQQIENLAARGQDTTALQQELLRLIPTWRTKIARALERARLTAQRYGHESAEVKPLSPRADTAASAGSATDATTAVADAGNNLDSDLHQNSDADSATEATAEVNAAQFATSLQSALPVQRSAADFAKLNQRLQEIEYRTASGFDTTQLQLDLLALVPQWQDKVAAAQERGLRTAKALDELKAQLRSGICSPRMEQYYQQICKKLPWFRRKADKEISFRLRKTAERLQSQGDLRALNDLLERARAIYGAAAEFELPPPPTSRPAAHVLLIDCGAAQAHALPNLSAEVSSWDIYIDETGESFSDDEAGTPGRMVAVCIPDSDQSLPDIGKFHSTEQGLNASAAHLAALLKSPCGILGFSAKALGLRGTEGWLQCARELTLWVWRLLPLPADRRQPAVLRVHIEQHNRFSPRTQTELGIDLLKAGMNSEDPARAKRLRLTDFSFAAKGLNKLSYPDVLAWFWDQRHPERTDLLKRTGLPEVCLIDCHPGLLESCRTALTGGMPTGAQWTELMSERPSEGSLISFAVAALSGRCAAQPEHWQIYARAMEDYLGSGQYRLDVLERMSLFLRPMKDPGLTAQFFWNCAELARRNHLGDVRSPELLQVKQTLAELTPRMQHLDPSAQLQIQLRLAVSDTNAFDFTAAESRLAPWDERCGGSLTHSALLDGKILSSLGQFRAFLRDPLSACALLRRALKTFEQLEDADPRQAAQQSAQTGTYLAIALMDGPHERTELENCLERTLGMTLDEAARVFASSPLERGPYAHYLFTRYLATDEADPVLRESYLKGSHLWTIPEVGTLSGHPWPQILYFRYLITPPDDNTLRSTLRESLSAVRGQDGMPTLELIVTAIAVSMGIFNPEIPAVRSLLLLLEEQIPCAASIVRQIMAAASGDEDLARRIIPFNFC